MAVPAEVVALEVAGGVRLETALEAVASGLRLPLNTRYQARMRLMARPPQGIGRTPLPIRC